MSSRRSAILRVALLSAVLVVSGCAGGGPGAPSSPAPTTTPVPSPTATSTPGGPPALGDLLLSPDGLGPLVLGEPIDPVLTSFDPHGCRTPENEDLLPPDDPVWEAWVPNYPKVPVNGGEVYPFEPHHEPDGTLLWLNIRSPEIRTADGVGLGSTRDDVTSAYPDAVAVAGVFATAYGIDGPHGRLVLEVSDDAESLGEPVDRVWALRVEPLEWQLQSFSGSDAGGWCAVGV